MQAKTKYPAFSSARPTEAVEAMDPREPAEIRREMAT